MKTNMKTNLNILPMVVAIGLLAISCKKQETPEKSLDASALDQQSVAAGINAIYSSWSVNWNGYPHQSTYTTSQAAADFGNVSGWNQSRAMISNGNLRITLLKNALSGAGGVVSNIDISDGSAYELDFTIRFHSAFDWSRGGKLGFGFAIGDGNAGGDPAWDGNGGTLRMMWYRNDAGRVYFQPYVYFRDQSGQFGETWGLTYPSSGSINKGQTYHVHMYIKSNTGSSTNGRAQILIDGNVLVDKTIRWTTNDSKRLIRTLTFHTFRGGSQSYWQSSSDGYIYYDDLVVNKLAN